MPPRSPARCLLAQQRPRSSNQAVWVRDDLLVAVFQSFCGKHANSKRHGSSVPGPMECRRRAGKRRLSAFAEAPPTPLIDVGTLWGYPTAVDRSQWQWQPPSNPVETKTITPAWPSWLQGVPAQTTTADADNLPDHTNKLHDKFETATDDFLHMITKIPTEEIYSHCVAFNERLRQDMCLGLIPQNTISWALEHIPAQLRRIAFQRGVNQQALRFSLYENIWKGLRGCKLLPVEEVEEKLLHALIYRLRKAIWDTKAQRLMTDICRTLSNRQLMRLDSNLRIVFRDWVSHCVSQAKGSDQRDGMVVIGEIKSDNSPQRRYNDNQLQISLRRLAKCLEKLPDRMTQSTVLNITQQVTNVLQTQFKCEERLRGSLSHAWAHAVANLSSTTESRLISVWKQLAEALRMSDNSSEPTEDVQHNSYALAMEYWMSRNTIKTSAPDRRTFQADPLNRCSAGMMNPSYDHQRHKAGRPSYNAKKLGLIIQLIHATRKPDDVECIFEMMKFSARQGFQIPSSLLKEEVHKMSLTEPRAAVELWKMQYILGKDSFVDPCELSHLMCDMICKLKMKTYDIFRLAGIPYSGWPRTRLNQQKLSPSKVDLVHKMATSFSRSEHTTNRQALRIIWQLVRYLRFHQANLGPEMSRALVRVGIIREMNEGGHWIGTSKLNWVAEMVSRGESEEVAHQVVDIVEAIRQKRLCTQVAEKKSWQNQID